MSGTCTSVAAVRFSNTFEENCAFEATSTTYSLSTREGSNEREALRADSPQASAAPSAGDESEGAFTAGSMVRGALHSLGRPSASKLRTRHQ